MAGSSHKAVETIFLFIMHECVSFYEIVSSRTSHPLKPLQSLCLFEQFGSISLKGNIPFQEVFPIMQ